MKAPEGTFSSVSDLTENRGSEQPVISLKIHHGAGFGYRKSPWDERNSTWWARHMESVMNGNFMGSLEDLFMLIL